MARVKFNVQFHADLKSAWGYPVEVVDGVVYGEVPDNLLEHEIAAGRVVKPVIEPVAEVVAGQVADLVPVAEETVVQPEPVTEQKRPYTRRSK